MPRKGDLRGEMADLENDKRIDNAEIKKYIFRY
jgi:hypothetical protein